MCERSRKLLLLNSLARSEWECQMVVIQAVHRYARWFRNLLLSVLPHRCWSEIGITLKLKYNDAQRMVVLLC